MTRKTVFASRVAALGRVTADELQREANITYKQLDYWCRLELLEHEREHDGSRSGMYRSFLPREVAVARLLGEVSALGLSPTSEVAQLAAVVARNGGGDVVSSGPLHIFVAESTR